MTNLKKQIEQSTAALRDAWTNVKSVPTGSSLPSKCFEQWSKRSAMHQLLASTISICAARDVAWNVVKQIANAQAVPGKANVVSYNNIEMEFHIARHLALTSYVSVTWSIYDRLSNVCGRLAGTTDLAENPKQNPKACEDLVGKKDVLGFSGHLHIREAYSWPLKVSYKIRNWLVHEGYNDGNVSLFDGDGIADQFKLHQDAIQYIQKCCGGAGDGKRRGDSTCVVEAADFWAAGDLLQILEQYNSEIHTLFVALLRWSVDSFVGQIKAFAARDQA